MSNIEYAKQKAIEQLGKILDDVKEIERLAGDALDALNNSKPEDLKKAVSSIDWQVDGYWGRIVLSQGTGDIHGYLQELQYAAEEEREKNESPTRENN